MKKSALVLFVIIFLGFTFGFMLSFSSVCKQTLSYSIGEFDQDFGISKTDFKNEIEKAGNHWEAVTGTNLFQYDPQSSFTINLIYDERQEKTIESDKILDQLHTLESSQMTTKEKYDSIKGLYVEKKASYDRAVSSYQQETLDYDKHVTYWNNQGGAPKAKYAELKKKRDDLQAQSTELKNQTNSLNDVVKSLNQLAKENNSLATEYNSQVNTYNSTANTSQFNKGEYLGDRINIYQFENSNDMEWVLTHELGHTLGLDHVLEPGSVMYYSVENNDETGGVVLSDADRDELKQVCGLTPYHTAWYKKIHFSNQFLSLIRRYQ